MAKEEHPHKDSFFSFADNVLSQLLHGIDHGKDFSALTDDTKKTLRTSATRIKGLMSTPVESEEHFFDNVDRIADALERFSDQLKQAGMEEKSVSLRDLAHMLAARADEQASVNDAEMLYASIHQEVDKYVTKLRNRELFGHLSEDARNAFEAAAMRLEGLTIKPAQSDDEYHRKGAEIADAMQAFADQLKAAQLHNLADEFSRFTDYMSPILRGQDGTGPQR